MSFPLPPLIRVIPLVFQRPCYSPCLPSSVSFPSSVSSPCVLPLASPCPCPSPCLALSFPLPSFILASPHPLSPHVVPFPSTCLALSFPLFYLVLPIPTPPPSSSSIFPSSRSSPFPSLIYRCTHITKCPATFSYPSLARTNYWAELAEILHGNLRW